MGHTLDIGAVEAGRVHLKGALVFATVVAGLTQLKALLLENKALVVDLQGLEHADSSALALLLQLVDEADQQQADLSFANLPDFLLGIAKLSNAEALLPLVS